MRDYRPVIEPFTDPDGIKRVIVSYDRGSSRVFGPEDLADQSISDTDRAMLADLMRNACWPLPSFPASGPNHNYADMDLERLHSRICRYLRKYVWFRDDRTYGLIAVWIIASYFREEFRFMPILNFDGVTVAGKSTTMRAIQEISYRGFMTGSYSSASTVRMIEKWRCSFFLDESLDNLNSDRGRDLANLLKASTSPDMPHIRADPKTQEVYTYHPYTSMAISTRGAEQPHDVVNRAIRIPMLTMPEDIELSSLSWADVDDAGSDITPDALRADLYATKILWEIHHHKHPEWVQWDANIRTAVSHFTEMLPSGEWRYAYVCGIEDGPRIWARQRDIATTLYSVAMECKYEHDTLRMIIESGQEIKESAENTMEAQVFKAFVDCILDVLKDAGVITIVPFTNVVSRITTREIAQRFNDNRFVEGNVENAWEKISTKTITHTLKALGLEYSMGAAAGRGSTMNPTARGFVTMFERYLKEYDATNAAKFHLSKK